MNGMYRTRERLDVGLERCIESTVCDCVIADDVHERHARAPRIVQMCDAIAEARAEVQQCAGGLAGHACIAVRGPRHDTLEQAEHAAHSRFAVECGNEMQLRGARIAEAHFDACGGQRRQQAFRAVHRQTSVKAASLVRGATDASIREIEGVPLVQLTIVSRPPALFPPAVLGPPGVVKHERAARGCDHPLNVACSSLRDDTSGMGEGEEHE